MNLRVKSGDPAHLRRGSQLAWCRLAREAASQTSGPDRTTRHRCGQILTCETGEIDLDCRVDIRCLGIMGACKRKKGVPAVPSSTTSRRPSRRRSVKPKRRAPVFESETGWLPPEPHHVSYAARNQHRMLVLAQARKRQRLIAFTLVSIATALVLGASTWLMTTL